MAWLPSATIRLHVTRSQHKKKNEIKLLQMSKFIQDEKDLHSY